MANKSEWLSNDTVRKNWEILKPTIEGIYAENKTTHSFQTLLAATHSIVRERHGAELHGAIKKLLAEQVRCQARIVSKCEDTDILRIFSQHWEWHAIKMRKVRDIFLYLDKNLAETKDESPGKMWMLQIGLFSKEFLKDEALTKKLNS
jgi:hypothetical protein